jgi:transposase
LKTPITLLGPIPTGNFYEFCKRLNIVLKSLPPYSPELNPVEKLWQWLKKHVCRNRLFAFMEDLMDTLAETLMNLTPNRFRELCQCSYLLQ